MLTEIQQTDLFELALSWRGTYAFTVTDGEWTAIPAADRTCVLTAASAVELQDLVRRDYAARRAATKGDVYLSERMST
jgi:hypothetical protein